VISYAGVLKFCCPLIFSHWCNMIPLSNVTLF